MIAAIIGLILMVIFFVICLIVGLCSATSGKGNHTNSFHRPPQKKHTRRCPNCGAPVALRGRAWECGFCGDCGTIQ